jgi:hypothetical protein
MMLTLYHGTSAHFADSIRQDGLFVGAFNVVSATLDPDLARGYALKGRFADRPDDSPAAGILVSFRVDEGRAESEGDGNYSIRGGVEPGAIMSIEPVPIGDVSAPTSEDFA